MHLQQLFRALCLTISLTLPLSCDKFVYDDLSDCFGNTLLFSYKADDGKEHLLEYVEKIDLFIYDASGNFVKTLTTDKRMLTEGINIKLPEGKYDVIAVANAYDNTVIKKQNPNGKVSRPELIDSDVAAAGGFDHLYLGKTVIESEPLSKGKDIIVLHSEHVQIHAVVAPDGDAAAWLLANKGEGFHLSVTGPLASRFYFDGTKQGTTSYDLPFEISEKDGCFVLDFNVLRFENDTPAIIRLKKGDTILCEVNVADYIEKYKKTLDISGKQEAVLPLYFKQNTLSMIVKVEPWKAIDVVPAL